MLPTTALTLAVHVHVAALLLAGHAGASLAARLPAARSEDGQRSAEYALVLLGAAGVALLITVWAKDTNRIGRLLDAIFDNLLSMVK